MPRFARACSLIVASASLVAACGGGDEASSGATAAAAAPVPEAELLVELTAAICGRQARCACEATRAECEAAVEARFAPLIASTKSTRPVYDGACARAALDALARSSCSDRVENVAPGSLLFCGSACRVFDAAPGQSCATTGLCPRGELCSYEGTPTCVACPVAGEKCRFGSCAPGAACGPGGLCEPLPRAGETCTTARGCGEGVCSAGACVVAAPLGAPCTDSRACASGYCPRGACDELPREGAPCPANRCGDGLACKVGPVPGSTEPDAPRCVKDTSTACQMPYGL